RILLDGLLGAQLAAAAWVYGAAVGHVTGTRRVLYTSLALVCALAALGRVGWTVHEVVTGRPPRPPLVETSANVAAQLAAMAGFVTALGRYRHRNWIRFEAMVDALLLIVAAAI